MRDARTSRGRWVRDAEVDVPGDPQATADRSTWTMRAVLQVNPAVPFLIGWRTVADPATEFYSEPAQTDPQGRLAMEVGDQDVVFVARPVDGFARLRIKPVKLTTEDDSRFQDTPRY